MTPNKSFFLLNYLSQVFSHSIKDADQHIDPEANMEKNHQFHYLLKVNLKNKLLVLPDDACVILHSIRLRGNSLTEYWKTTN
jgi:hypothetical protein